MIPFIILVTVPIAIAPFVKNVRINRISLNKLPLFLFFLMMTLLIMLRHKYVGNDTSNYMRFFEKYAFMNWNQIGSSKTEIGFVVFNKLIALFTRDPHAFIAISGLAVSAMLYPTYRRLCVDPSLTIVLFCTMSTFTMMFSGIRQMLAIGLGVLAYEFTNRKKLVFFIITVAVALTFHTSAFMLAPMYPLYRAKITRKWLFFVIPILIVLFIFNKPVFSVLSMVLERFTNYEAVETATGAYTMLILLILFAVVSYVIPDESKMSEDALGMRNFLLLSVAIQMFAPINTWALRMDFYYIIFVPLLLPMVLRSTSMRFRQFAVVIRYVMIGFFYVYFFFLLSTGGGLHIAPYHFYWESYYL